MKKFKINKGIIFFIAFLLFSIILFSLYLHRQSNQLAYDKKNSFHHEFYIENEYVIFRDEIKIKNLTSKDLHFYMSADVSENSGLVAENTAIACKQNSLQKEQFFIKAKSEQVYDVYFKVKKGAKDTKFNRLSPKKLTFEILE